MKRIILVSNPGSNPVKFPADVNYFYVSPLSAMGSKRAKDWVLGWLKDEGRVLISIEAGEVEDIKAGQSGITIREER